MVGRSAIRNAWIIRQIREHLSGEEVYEPTLGDVFIYSKQLKEIMFKENIPERNQVNRLKKFFNFIGLSVDPDGKFLYEIRRVKSYESMDEVLHRYLRVHSDKPFATEPYPGLVARPNRETQVKPLTSVSVA